MMRGIRIPTTWYLTSQRHLVSRSFNASCRRSFSQGPHVSPEMLQKMMSNPLINRLAKSENAMSTLQQTAEILQEKGYNGDIGVMKQMKLLFDKDVREQFSKLRDVMHREGIDLREEDLKGLYDIIGLKQPK